MKTHINQTNKNETQRTNIKSSKAKATNNVQEVPLRLTEDLSTEALWVRRERQDILSDERTKLTTTTKTYSQDYSIRQGSYLYSKEK